MIDSAGVERAHKTIGQDEQCENDQQQLATAGGQQAEGAFFMFVPPTCRLKTFPPTQPQLNHQQQTQGVTAVIHGPNGPGLGSAEGPGAKQDHEIYQRGGKIFANPVGLDVRGSQHRMGYTTTVAEIETLKC
jgi:hypothetical protein